MEQDGLKALGDYPAYERETERKKWGGRGRGKERDISLSFVLLRRQYQQH